jgi:hypothetical protein
MSTSLPEEDLAERQYYEQRKETEALFLERIFVVHHLWRHHCEWMLGAVGGERRV